MISLGLSSDWYSSYAITVDFLAAKSYKLAVRAMKAVETEAFRSVLSFVLSCCWYDNWLSWPTNVQVDSKEAHLSAVDTRRTKSRSQTSVKTGPHQFCLYQFIT